MPSSIQNFAQKAVRKARFLAADALFASGFWQAEKVLAEGHGQRILCYHGLDEKGEKGLNGRFLAASRFEEQVRFLTQNAQIVRLEDFFDDRFDDQKFTVAISFDDGFRNQLTRALPILEKHGAPAAFFLTAAAEAEKAWIWTDFLDAATRLGPERIEIDGLVFRKKRWRHTRFFADAQGRKLADRTRFSDGAFLQKMETAFQNAGAWAEAALLAEYWQLLAPAEIRSLAASDLATVGAHGATHRDLAFLPLAEAVEDLKSCKIWLEKMVEKPVAALAYPFGAYSRPLVEEAEKLGFSMQFAVDFLHFEDKSDARLRERLVVNPFISNENQWLAVREGHY